MTPADDDLLTALRSARPDPGYCPSPRSPEATAMLADILAARREPARTRRMTRRRLVLAGLPALAVAVVATVVAVSATTSGSAPDRLSAASVRTAILLALRQHSGDLLYRDTTHLLSHGGSVSVWAAQRSWVYPAFPAVGQQVRCREVFYRGGKLYQDVESIYTEDAAMEHPTMTTAQGPRSARIVAVDYPSRIWARFTTTTPLLCRSVGSPALIRSEIASGRFTVDGTVKLNGRQAVKLSWTELGAHNTAWVDSRTYVPLRLVSTTPWGPGRAIITMATAQMHPATAASLKLLAPVIPVGFTRAAKVPGFGVHNRIGK